MAKKWDERLASLSVKLDELSKKAAAASEDAKVYLDLRRQAIEDKIGTARGNVAAMQENVRIAEDERQGKLLGALLKARMTTEARREDFRDARDKRRLEAFIDDELNYILDCYDAVEILVADAELSILEVAGAIQEYQERFVGKGEE